MATDATGTPTNPDSIPTYNTNADAPSGLGFNAAMAAIQTALSNRPSKPAGLASGETMVYNGVSFDRSTTTRVGATSLGTGTPDATKFLRGDGSWQAVAAGSLLGMQVFTASGTYTPTSGTTRVWIECVGGGGAGGGAPATDASHTTNGGGGGGGAYAASFMTTGFSGKSYVIGAGGTGVSGAAGNAGGSTTFDTSVIVAVGGAGGQPGNAGLNNYSGNGGAGGARGSCTGNMTLSGATGMVGQSSNTVQNAGAGGTAALGGGNGVGGYIVGAGQVNGSAGNQGGGGGGSVNWISMGALAGGAGGSGFIRIWEFA